MFSKRLQAADWTAAGVVVSTVILLLAVLSMVCRPAEAKTYDRRTPVVEAVEKSESAVVNIRTEKIIKQRVSPYFGFNDSFFNDFFKRMAPSRTFRTQSLGSGVIVDPRGYILTNAHVIEKASGIYVAQPGAAREMEASLVGLDRRIDLAVLKVESDTPLPYLPLGRSDDLMVGETVIAIGNPLGLGHSITTGIVSAPWRRIPMGEGSLSIFIQTDALINPGNSGGPLLNINGELIGINTAIARQAQGIGFAIPAQTIKRILDDLIEKGDVRRAYLGVIPRFIQRDDNGVRSATGVLVKDVDRGSPADRGGIRKNDIIVSLDGIRVSSGNELFSLLESYAPGSEMKVLLVRDRQPVEMSVSLDEMQSGYGLQYAAGVFGFSVADSSSGVMVVEVLPGMAAERVGIRSGDLIVEIEGVKLADLDAFAAVIEKMMGREPHRFLIGRGRRGYYVELPDDYRGGTL